jgi:hypothetical protein
MFKRINEPVKNANHNANANTKSFNNVFIIFVFLLLSEYKYTQVINTNYILTKL